MDESVIENQASSPNKFIFADAFYNSLAENDDFDYTTENSLDDSSQSVENVTVDGFSDILGNDSNIENNLNTELNLDLQVNNDSDDLNLDNSKNNIDFLLSGSNINTGSVSNDVVENSNINVVPAPNEENINSFSSISENSDILNNLNTESTVSDNTDNVSFSTDNNGVEQKQDFTQFLLGKNVNYQPVNVAPTVDVRPTPSASDDMIITSEPLDESLKVETGVDKDLENFLFSRRTLPEVEKEDEFAAYRSRLEPEEKTFYKAARRKRENTINQTLMSNFEPSVNVDVNPIINTPIPEVEEEEEWHPDVKPQPVIITEEVNYDEPIVYENEEVVISNLLDELSEKSKQTGKISILAKYGDDFCSHNYITNPAIGREREIRELGLILLTPEKSAILVGKPGIGKTSIVEGLAYRIQRNRVPDALKGYRIVSIKTTSLLGSLSSGETRLQTLIDEIKELDKIILFIDEVHMLMGATNESSLDFANMFKESLGRGSIKMIGATTSDEYERYVLRDKAFVRRFQRVDVAEPTRDQTVEILMGTLPKIEKNTGAKLKYTHYIQSEIMGFIVDITSEYKRVYGIGSRYPDICITLVSQAFSEAVFDNRNEVNILDIRDAIASSKNIYPDVIKKELINFDIKFKDLINQENK